MRRPQLLCMAICAYSKHLFAADCIVHRDPVAQALGMLSVQVLPMNTGVEGGETAIKLARCAAPCRSLCLRSPRSMHSVAVLRCVLTGAGTVVIDCTPNTVLMQVECLSRSA